MSPQPLTFDYAATGLAYALSRANGNKTVALSIPTRWDGSADMIVAAVDRSATHRGHSALVNLIQNVKRDGGYTSNIAIYLSEPPTHADKGMFIEQVHGNSSLSYLRNGTVYYIRPTHDSRHGAPTSIDPPPRHDVPGAAPTVLNDPLSWFSNVQRNGDSVNITHGGRRYDGIAIADENRVRTRQLLGLRVRDIRIYKAPLGGRAPRIAIPASEYTPTTYTAMSITGRRFFDYIFAYTAMALVPARLAATADAPVSGLQGHNVGAVLTNESGSLLSWGLNFGQLNATLHAEVSLLKAWQALHGGATAIPPNARLYTTLEPCFMCAGQIASYADVGGFTIIYVQSDPKFHPLPTFLTDARLETYDADDLGLTYRGKGIDWTTRLAATQARLAQHSAPGRKRASYQESAISVLNSEPSQTRRFAKAAWDLAELGEKIVDSDYLSGAQRGMLLAAWMGAMQLVMKVGGHLPAGTTATKVHLRSYMSRLGVYLDDTSHKNDLRAAADPAYRARAAGGAIVVVNKYQMRALSLADRITAFD
jgi:tRNA(Arg) A34 adenosine deaminase TadA